MEINTDFLADKIHHQLKGVRLRPHVYLNSKSITALEGMFIGYMAWGRWGFYYPELVYDKNDICLGAFSYWLQDEPIIAISSMYGFSKYLLDKCDNNEERAFDLFFERLDKFSSLHSDPNSEGNVSSWWK